MKLQTERIYRFFILFPIFHVKRSVKQIHVKYYHSENAVVSNHGLHYCIVLCEKKIFFSPIIG